MASKEDIEEAVALEIRASEDSAPAEQDVNPHGAYALSRVDIITILERLTDGNKINALEILTRFENANLATALLYAPDAAKARKAFSVGQAIFCKDLD